jgi:hypothetical protein
VAVLKYVYTYGRTFREEDTHFANFLCSILDMKKNGHVTGEDIEDFLESMENSEIEEEVL